MVNDYRWLRRAKRFNLIPSSLDPIRETSDNINLNNIRSESLLAMMWRQMEHTFEGKDEDEILNIVKEIYQRYVKVFTTCHLIILINNQKSCQLSVITMKF